jgi:hypothetical protein
MNLSNEEVDLRLAQMKQDRQRREGNGQADDDRQSQVGQESSAGGKKKDETQAQVLTKIAAESGLFHAPNGTGYADIIIGNHRQTWAIRGQGFRRWLMREFYKRKGNAPSPNAMQAALGLIEAMVQFDGPEHEVHVRVAGHNGKIYLDLADEYWRAVEIDACGWRVVTTPPVKFRRAAGMQPLPLPVRGSTVDNLRRFLNVKNDDDFVLAVAWLLAALRDCGPYPVLALSGEQGSAKSSFSMIMRSLADPNTAPLRALPREDRDLFIAANNGHTLAFDNVSGMPNWISDTLCRLATGGGFAVRQLYTDHDEVLFDSCRPIILNGIEDCISRPDLADRAVFLVLEAIPESERKSEQHLFAEFNHERPGILGALLDAVSHGLKRLPTVYLDHLPRMVDFAKWATACETALWETGTFAKAYGCNREETVDRVLEADPVATTLRSFMANRIEWTGTASELLGALSDLVSEVERRSKKWPTAANSLSGRLRRTATFLRQIGIKIDGVRQPDKSRTRVLHITREEKIGNPSSEPSNEETAPLSVNGLASDASDGTSDDKCSTNDNGPSDRHNPLDNKSSDGVDDEDDQIPPPSCAHCRRPGGNLQRTYYGTAEAWLHPGCQDAWCSAQDLTILPEPERRAEQ